VSDGADRRGFRVRASRANAVILIALGAALVSMMLVMAGPQRASLVDLFAFAPFVLGLAAILLACGAGLAVRWRPVFEVGENGIAMPVGLMGLVQMPWSAVAGWGVTSRRIPWLPLLHQTVFGVWLTDRRVLPRWRQSEISLNRMMIGADLVVNDWFVPRGFDAMEMACREIRPDLERQA